MSRGVDDEGNASNFVETEQVVLSDGHITSYVIVRGRWVLAVSDRRCTLDHALSTLFVLMIFRRLALMEDAGL